PLSPTKSHAGEKNRREKHESPFCPAETGETRERSRRAHPAPSLLSLAARQRQGREPETCRVPDAIAHAEKRAAGVRHEEKRRDREDSGEESHRAVRQPAKRQEQRRQDSHGGRGARQDKAPEARPEDAKKKGLKVGSEGTEPVHHVAIEEVAPGKGVGNDPF